MGGGRASRGGIRHAWAVRARLYRSWLVLATGFMLPPVLCGCGSDFASVKGQVLLDGKPLRNAVVAFHPERGRGSFGRTAADGRYELRYTDKQAGIPPGPCQVRITTAEDEQKEILPTKYNSKSELTQVVNPGPNEFNFSLSSK